MYTFRCTQRLLKRMHLSARDLAETATGPTTTALGDWYAHLVFVQRQHLVMCVSERSRLCVLTPARDVDGLSQRFHYVLIDLLRTIEVPEEAIQTEKAAMIQRGYGLTTGPSNGRSVLGSMNDFTYTLRYYDLKEWSLMDLSLLLSKTPCTPLKMQYPGEVAFSLLTSAAAAAAR